MEKDSSKFTNAFNRFEEWRNNVSKTVSGKIDEELDLGSDTKKDATIDIEKLNIYIQNNHILKDISLQLHDKKITCIIGPSGCGKTTLLKSILGLIPAISGTCELGENLQIGYFEQEVKGDNRTTCIEEIWQEFPSFTQYEVRSALAKCGLTTKHIESQVRVLSGGEQAKVRLCKLVNRDTNILLLDEPTNHLDMKKCAFNLP